MLAEVVPRAACAAIGESNLSFDSLYAEHFDFVWRNLRRLGVAESSLRDAAQEVFLVVHQRLGEFVPRGTLRSWLYSILRRVAATQKRRLGSKFLGATKEVDEIADEVQLSPESHAVRGQSLQLLLELLDGLDCDKRDALVLVDLEEMSVPEACMALDVNPNTLYSRLRAARQQMRQGYARRKLNDWRQR